ncbi:MAG: transcriptional repressor [Firmicutes bacterium]|nr:transcriptional repressor [Bacillota bacterium]
MNLQAICDALDRVGIRPTQQRIEIMKYLVKHRVHPTAEMIYAELKQTIPTFSKTTVYNTLKLLAEKGVVLALATDEDQVRYEANLTPHGHFKCVRCDDLFDLTIADMASPGDEIEGNLVLEYQVLVKGVCRRCRTAENPVLD